jgi:hypothetical protein
LAFLHFSPWIAAHARRHQENPVLDGGQTARAKLRLMVKRILRKYKYPPDQQEAAVELVLQQAEALGEAWG